MSLSLTVNAIIVQEVHRHFHRRLHGVQVFGECGHHLGLEEPLLIPLRTLFWQSQGVEESGPAMTGVQVNVSILKMVIASTHSVTQ